MTITAKSHLLRAISKSDNRHHRHCTLVFRSGALLGVGYNRGYRHSEINAFNNIWWDKRKGTTIVNLCIKRNGIFGNARPCTDCMQFLIEQNVKKITYFDGSIWKTERI